MKRIVATLLLTVITGLAISQTKSPVNWAYEAKKKTADTYDIVITANIDHPWHIYSQKIGKGGPVPTSIKFKANPLVVKNGPVKEIGKLEKVFDNIFNIDVLFYSDKVQFVQTVKLKGKIKTSVSGVIDYMLCDDSHCLPPTKQSFDLKLQ